MKQGLEDVHAVRGISHAVFVKKSGSMITATTKRKAKRA
jgi:hypothetical protein